MTARAPASTGAAPSTGVARSRILESLIAATEANPNGRKRLLGPDVNYGRELLVALARVTGGWIGWEAVNLRGIAEELAFVTLAERDLRIGSDIEIGALVDHALANAIETDRVGARFAALRNGLGFRRAVRDAVLELRTGGIAAARLRTATQSGAPAYDLAAVLELYEQELASAKLADPALVFGVAQEAFDREAPFVLSGETYIAPAAFTVGLPSKLVERLLAHGAKVIGGDRPQGVEQPRGVLSERESADPPASLLAWAGGTEMPGTGEPINNVPVTTDMFAAATPSEELREVFRRVVAEGLRWDEVEIVATDTDTYGIALDALTQRLGVGATMLHGVPLERTRLGRALERWLGWLEDGLPADTLRQSLEAGELALSDASLPPSALARELRRLQIGWGRERYLRALLRLDKSREAPEVERRDDETAEAFAERVEYRRRVSADLYALLERLMEAVPALVPERGVEATVYSTTAALAGATLRWLALVDVHGQAEEQTALRLRTRLEQIERIDDPDMTFANALAALRDALADLRSWPYLTSDRKPWSASGGMVHLMDIAHAGTTGRPRVFIVGLDANRAAGSGAPDPFLTDALRTALGTDALATSVDRRAQRAWSLGAALASLRGRVTLSYAARGSLDEREAGPSSVLLQTLRLLEGDASLAFEKLREHLRPPASAVPHAISRIDARDVYLSAIADGPLLLDGLALVRAAFPMLDAGLLASEERDEAKATPYNGLVKLAAPVLDPTRDGARAISPSGLELLATCPLAWFYRYGLYLRAPQDPEYDAERWLDEMQRGTLLHSVFEEFARRYQGRQHDIAREAALLEILAIVNNEIAQWRELVPPPGESVFETEAEELRQAARAFLDMERVQVASGDDGEWWQLEVTFGENGERSTYALSDGRVLPVRGRADRVDRMPDGSLRVIDYKTGRSARFRDRKQGHFAGGRRLQPAIYAGVLAQLLRQPVSRFEYRFPTGRGGNDIIGYDGVLLAEAQPIIERILELVSNGAFLPTDDPNDCKYCEHQEICRASRDDWGAVESPRAEWAKEHASEIALYRPMLRNRQRTGDGR